MLIAARRLALLGLVLMLAGALGPWAGAQDWTGAPAVLSGWGHGGEVVVAFAAVAALMLRTGERVSAGVAGALALAFVSVAAVTQSGALQWGLYAAWLGALCLVPSALVRRTPAVDVAPLRRR